MNKKLIAIIGAVIVLLGAAAYFLFFGGEKLTDAEKFSAEYTEVGEDNIFVYRTSKEIIHILEKGTGVVYLGFPECPWCQAYVPYLESVAKETGVEKIYYLNILEDRKNNTSDYQKIVSLLEGNLLNNDEGNPRVYVPDVTVVKEGVILGHDNETSVVSEEDGTPKEYWTTERVNALKAKLKPLLLEVSDTACTTCGE